MLNRTYLFLNNIKFALLMLIWVFLLFSPWAVWLESLPWVRLGITLIIFSTPGIIVSLILAGERFSLFTHLISGLTFSILFVGSLGLLGRVFHLPFAYIKPVFSVIGLFAFLALIRYSRLGYKLYKPKRFPFTVVLIFLLLAVVGVITSMGTTFAGDDFNYLSYLTTWQHAQQLNFHEVIFNTGGIDSIRFWSAMFPMNLAFLSDLSNIPGLFLIAFYVEPVFVVLSLISFYNLFDDLLTSEYSRDYLPITALVLHFTFLFMLYQGRQPGSMFFFRMSEDKSFAAFLIAPAFFIAIRYFLDKITLKSVLFALLIGFGLALTHPIILAYSVMIAGLYISFLTLAQRDYKKFIFTVILLIAVILPSSFLRVAGMPLVSKYIFGIGSSIHQPGVFDIESASEAVDASGIISSIEGTPFYGFNVDLVQILSRMTQQENPLQTFFSWSYLWILGLSFLWGLFNLKKKTVAAFVAATSLLVLLCAIPYTGWLFGFLVSARMLWRTPWMFSAGLGALILTYEAVDFLFRQNRFQIKKQQFSTELIICGLVFVVSSILITLFSVNYYKQGQKLEVLDNKKNKLQKFVDLGNFLENNIETVSTFVAPADISDYLPGISSKSKIVFFRTETYSRQPVNRRKLSFVFSKNTTITKVTNILRQYHIDYIITPNVSLKDYYVSQYPQYFEAQKFDTFWIIEFQGTKP